MENKFLANNVVIIYMIILIALPIAASNIYWLETLFPFGIALLFTIIIFIFQKRFFSQILLNEKGISVIFINLH